MFKKIASSSLLVVLLSLNFSSTAFALSVSEDTFTVANDGVAKFIPLDYAIGGGTGANDQHIIGLDYTNVSDPETQDPDLIYLTAADGNSNFGSKQIIEASFQGQYATMKVDSVGDVHVAWNYGIYIYYRQKVSGTWYNKITVSSTQSIQDNKQVGLEVFLTEGGTYYTGQEGLDDPIITACSSNWGGDLGYFTVKDSSGTGNSLDFEDTALTIKATTGGYNCENSSIIINGNDANPIVVAQPGTSDGDDVFYCTAETGTWNCASNVITGMYKPGDQYAPIRLSKASSTGDVGLLVLRGNSGNTSNSLVFSDFYGGVWGTAEIIGDGFQEYSHVGPDIGETVMDLEYDEGTQNIWTTYFDENNSNLFVAYKQYQGSSWNVYNSSTNPTLRIDTSMGVYGSSPNSYAVMAFDAASDTEMYVVAGYFSNSAVFTAARYQLTSLPGSGEGEGVPEFSTYVYIMTIIVGFGLINKKTREHGFLTAA